ncbi:hypothetical protein N0B44_15765 [Roseibacterium beibuensis]|uniref:Uncharacterized protein n=1 Tax=[Roseibacterium] beibuensis TaxID=1193142 RepID=A0ABP9LCU3_9RHOB|nr:hypothetical protein [Roseibacterium beibuensis]MCS6624376.1 hypothetical protein [Roseibacterium beibuensis]
MRELVIYRLPMPAVALLTWCAVFPILWVAALRHPWRDPWRRTREAIEDIEALREDRKIRGRP